jgi:predicted aldo/keto reductase-like oxidoreductase
MLYKELCGERISRLGMGNMRLPTVGPNGPIDEAKAQAIIDFVYESGVNYFDTAYMYHGGKSEAFVGKALRNYPRDSYFLATKMPESPLREGRSPREVFEEQLARCGVDHFDFYLLHNLNERSYEIFTDPERGIIDYLLEQKRLGRIRHLGLSSHAKPETLKRFLDTYDFPEFVQLQLNYFDWDYQDARQQYAIVTGHGIPVWVMEPCRGGRLADLSEAANGVLKAAAPDRSIASWAFRYVRDLPNVGVVLCGMTQMDQAVDNVATFSDEAPFSQTDKQTLQQALDLFRAEIHVPCTVCHYCDGCPAGLDIPTLLAAYNQSRLTSGFGIRMALERLPADQRPGNCIACGACQQKCPQNIAIPAVFASFAETLAGLQPPRG